MNSNIDLHLREAALNSIYNVWNALLTLNGIFITVFSGIAILGTSNRILIMFIVVLGIVSSWLLLWNFITARNLYERIGKISPEQYEKLSEKERNDYVDSALKDHKRNKCRENIVIFFFIMQSILILAIVLI